LLSIRPANAGSRSAAFAVSATMMSACRLETTSLDPGDDEPDQDHDDRHDNSDADWLPAVTLTCSAGTSATITTLDDRGVARDPPAIQVTWMEPDRFEYEVYDARDDTVVTSGRWYGRLSVAPSSGEGPEFYLERDPPGADANPRPELYPVDDEIGTVKHDASGPDSAITVVSIEF
jgi:hypothetical protein